MDNRFPSHVHTLLEVRLTDAEQDYWEAKYMIDEAMDKSKSGQMNDLSDEQRLVLAIVQPSLQLDLYWGKKFYNKQCYFQALYHFNRVFENLRKNCNSWNDNVRNLYDEISYYIGFIYTDLKMYDRAFYYLWPAQSNGDINATYEFVNCLCNMKDVGAKGYISSKAKEVTELMNKSEEEVERLLPLYNFLRRRYVYALIDREELDEAEEMLNEMIKEEQDLEFANGELEYIKTIKENAQGDSQKETDE
jgi:tetratricopeptide (TPR) repeat protein